MGGRETGGVVGEGEGERGRSSLEGKKDWNRARKEEKNHCMNLSCCEM